MKRYNQGVICQLYELKIAIVLPPLRGSRATQPLRTILKSAFGAEKRSQNLPFLKKIAKYLVHSHKNRQLFKTPFSG